MLRTHTRPARRALTLGLVGAMLVAPAPADGKLAPAPAPTAAPAPAPTPAPTAGPTAGPTAAPTPAPTATPKPPPPPPPVKPVKPAKDSDEPDAGDGNIASEPLEPGQLGPATGGTGRQSSARPSLGMARPTGTKRSSVEQGLELSDLGDQAFDSGDYDSAARLYSKALELLSENESNHMTRSVVLANVVTSYEQMAASTGEVAHLRTAQRLIQEYLRACKTKHGTGCERYPETQEARSRLLALNKRIDEASPLYKKIPPEIDRAPGGKAYDLAVEQPSAPGWIGPAIAGGILLAGGGAAVIYYAATAEKYGPLYPREGATIDTREGETLDTDGAVDTDGGDGTDTSNSAATIEISPETRGKLLIGIGVFMAAAGIGFAVLGSLRLAKHRRLNRQRAESLSVTPTFGRGSAGLSLTGRF
ncbi:MAG: hypothetical protein H0T76_28915 [Nannocystis sp.]|nr:hypothetical protein [Nannocystis sp.]MBA3550516.1 hypothetical protein [Nannocystis sp.]